MRSLLWTAFCAAAFILSAVSIPVCACAVEPLNPRAGTWSGTWRGPAPRPRARGVPGARRFARICFAQALRLRGGWQDGGEGDDSGDKGDGDGRDGDGGGELLSDYDVGDVEIEEERSWDGGEESRAKSGEEGEEGGGLESLGAENGYGNGDAWKVWGSHSDEEGRDDGDSGGGNGGLGGWGAMRKGSDTAREKLGLNRGKKNREKKESAGWRSRRRREEEEQTDEWALEDDGKAKRQKGNDDDVDIDGGGSGDGGGGDGGGGGDDDDDDEEKDQVAAVNDMSTRHEGKSMRDGHAKSKRGGAENEEGDENLLARALESSSDGEEGADDVEGGEEGAEGSEDALVREELARLERETAGEAKGGMGILAAQSLVRNQQQDVDAVDSDNSASETLDGAGMTGGSNSSDESSGPDYISETVSEWDSKGECWPVLTEHWEPEDDSNIDEIEAGRRVFGAPLLDKLCDGLDCRYVLQNHSSNSNPDDFLERFGHRPKVVIIGRDADKLEAKLPKGFILDRENETCSVLCRKSSPPPLLCQGSDDDDDDDDNEGWTGEADRWGPRAADEGEEGGDGEGNVYDEMPDAASLTDREFRDAVRRRMQVLREKAEAEGDVVAIMEIAARMFHGNGTRKNVEEGFKWMLKAAAAGHPRAQMEIGSCYQEGRGIRQDDKQAATWFKLAAKDRLDEEGVPEAMHNLGVCYGNGMGVERDDVLACTWYKKAAKCGLKEAQFNLAYHYARGKGLRVHERKAAYWLLQAAKQGHEDAALLLGVRYMQGQGTRKDYDQGIKWVRKSSHWGCQDASNLLDAISNGTQPDKVAELLRAASVEKKSTYRSRDFADTHEEMTSALRKQLEEASRRVASKQRREEAEREREGGDRVPTKLLGKRASESYAEAQLDAMRRLSKAGIQTARMKQMQRDMQTDEEEGMDWGQE